MSVANRLDRPAFKRSPVGRALTSRWGARLTSYVVFIIGWQLLAMLVERVPGPWETMDFIWREVSGGDLGGVRKGQFLEHFGATVPRFAIGLIASFVVGTVVGIAIGSVSFVRALLSDVLLVFLALPAIIWAFLTVMWYGLGWEAPVYTVILSATPFVAVNVAQGVRAVSPELHRMSDAFGVPRNRRLRSLMLPAVTGYLFTGLRFAVIIGWNAVLLAEWFGATDGVGWRARLWYDAARYRGFIGWAIIFIVFIFLLDGLVLSPIQKRAFRWRDSAGDDLELELELGVTDMETIAKTQFL
jgi:NitT/TauT family transport system permease protein